MNELDKQLQYLKTLEAHLTYCPASCYSAIAQTESEHLAKSPALQHEELNAGIVLRHARLVEYQKEQAAKPLKPTDQDVITTDALLISEINKCTDCLGGAAAKPPLSVKDTEELIFNQCLAKAIRRSLSVPDFGSFSSEKILKNAIEDYKRIIYKEELHFLEIDKLLSIHQKTNTTPNTEKRAGVRADLYLLDQAHNPTTLIGKKFGVKTNITIDNFKLTDTNHLYNALDEMFSDPEPSLEKIKSAIGTFLENNENNDDLFKMVKRNIFFENMSNDLNQCIERTNGFISNINNSFNQVVVHAQPKETNDPQLQSLRNTVKNYIEVLNDIDKAEKKTYTNRNQNLLYNRRQAIETLERCINQETQLTPSVRTAVTALVTEVNNNKPHWKELPMLHKILDILSLGLTALIRNKTIGEYSEQKALKEKLNEMKNDTSTNNQSIVSPNPNQNKS